MRRLVLLPLLTLLVLLPAACADERQPTAPVAVRASVGARAPAPVTVMSRNMYLGANIDPLIAGGDPIVALSNALAQLQHTDYPARAVRLAQEIASRGPAAVGLQEVSHFRIDLVGAPVIEYDFLDILLMALTQLHSLYGTPLYTAVVHQENLNLTIPVGGMGGLNSIQYVDGDAILVRSDVQVSDPAHGHFDTQQVLNIPIVGLKTNLRGWNAVTLHLEGSDVRFVNTHLEIQAFREVQEAQAQELVDMLADETLPVVLVGDFNSAANRTAPADSKTGSYGIFLAGGFADLEARQPHSETMVTCCREPELTDPLTSAFNQRLDLVLTRYGNVGFGGESKVEIVASPQFQDGSYMLWPSDHAAVFAQLWPARGLAQR